jgi:hypothetical protein
MGNLFCKRSLPELECELSLKNRGAKKNTPLKLEKTNCLFQTTFKKTVLVPCCEAINLCIDANRPRYINLRGKIYIFVDQAFRNRAACGEKHDPIHPVACCDGNINRFEVVPEHPGVKKCVLKGNYLSRIKLVFHVNHSNPDPCRICPILIYIKGILNGRRVVHKHPGKSNMCIFG